MSGAPSGARAVAHRALLAAEAEPRVFLKALLARPEVGYLSLSPRDRALCRELCYGVVRHRRTLLQLVASRAKVRPDRQDPPTRAALLLGCYQLVFLEGVKPHAAVGETVALCGSRGRRGFVNAVLRALASLAGAVIAESEAGDAPRAELVPLRRGRLRRLGAPILPDWAADHASALGVAFSMPTRLVKRWLRALGPARTRQVLAASNEVPPLIVRARLGRIERDALAARFEEAGVASTPVAEAPHALALSSGVGVAQLPGFSEGLFSVQDATAQRSVAMVGAQPGDRIWDVCAAPGGKAFALADALEGRGEVVCTDPDEARLARLVEEAERLGLSSLVGAVSGAAASVELPGSPTFDRVLVDVPCSNTGVLARRVEARWRVARLDLKAMAATQLALLERAQAAVRPGGSLVYSTCSIEEPENGEVAAAFQSGHPDFQLEEELTVLPGDGVGDGGFAVRWRRATAP